jgi:N-acetylmuramoyl-L-alanine amidase
MPSLPRKTTLLPPVAALAILVAFLLRHTHDDTPAEEQPPSPAPALGPLSVLGEVPDWSRLDIYQNTITRAGFERLLTTIFVTGGGWRESIEIRDDEALIRTGLPDDPGVFHLRFAPEGSGKTPARTWKSAADLPPAPPEKPLDGLHIAIDPGHIGGEWAAIEERWLKAGDHPPVQEGDMTLLVARLLKPRLEALGAKVTLVREKNQPVTPLRPDALMSAAKQSTPDDDPPHALRLLAERLFYRTAEIRARAKLVNETIKPDLALCLHFNAEHWGPASNPLFVDRTHFHILLNGAYTDGEIAMADQRFAMLEKLLGGTHHEEALVGATVADVFARMTELPPYLYPPDSPTVRPVNAHPHLWARNLLANRLYSCPVIFMEPYVMNSTIDHPRLVAGDYEGMREINGRMRPSVFREYADALTEGLRQHYASARQTAE